jgi:hypothetical protein
LHTHSQALAVGLSAWQCSTDLTYYRTYPLITVSTRAQVQQKTTEKHQNVLVAQMAAFQKIIKEEGISGLYSYGLIT